MKNTTLVLLLFALAFLFSCSNESVKSSNNYITDFSIEGVSPIDIEIRTNSIIIWTEPYNSSLLMSKTPIIEVSEGAEISKHEENPSYWFQSDFKYVVTAENGETRIYYVLIDYETPKKYSFETWKLSDKGNYTYDEPDSRWASGNEGIGMAFAFAGRDSKDPEIYPTKKTENGYSGNAVLMETIEGFNVFGLDRPLISGNLFLGKFDVGKAINGDELGATELGRAYQAKPKKITGWYKYKEGPGNFSDSGVVVPSRRDSCNIHAQFYQSDFGGKDTTLTVKDIDTSSLVIARAQLPSCGDTEGDDFKPFELVFEYESEPDLKNHRYKLAITFASSKYGDSYAGKFGSKLTIDEIEIIDDNIIEEIEGF